MALNTVSRNLKSLRRVHKCAVCLTHLCVLYTSVCRVLCAVQLQEQAGSLQQAYQLAFTLAALQKLGAPMSATCIDKVCGLKGGMT